MNFREMLKKQRSVLRLRLADVKDVKRELTYCQEHNEEDFIAEKLPKIIELVDELIDLIEQKDESLSYHISDIEEIDGEDYLNEVHN